MPQMLLGAVSTGRPRQVRLLLDSGLSTEHQDDCAQTALIRAIFLDHSRNREKIINMLLKYGANVGHTDVVGRSALSWGCLYGRDKEVAMLLRQAEGDVDLNHTDVYGQTALFHAVTSGSASCVKLMVDALNKYSLSVSKPNHAGITPLIKALQLQLDVCASILMYQGGASKTAPGTDPHSTAAIAEKWANRRVDSSALLDKFAKQATSHQRPVFPPIMAPHVAQKIQYQEKRACLLQVTLDSEDDQSHNAGLSFFMDEQGPRTSTAKQQDSAKLSIRSVSMTSSTEAQVDSSEEEPDDFSAPMTDGKKLPYSIGDLYRIYEEQATSSYRPTAARHRISAAKNKTELLDQESTVTGVSTPTKISVNSPAKTHTKRRTVNHPEYRKMVLRRQHRQMTLDPVAPTRFPPPPPECSSSSEDSDLSATMSGKLWLPRLPSKTNLLRSSRDSGIGACSRNSWGSTDSLVNSSLDSSDNAEPVMPQGESKKLFTTRK